MNEVLRQEKKILITLSQMYRLNAYLTQLMTADSHGGGEGYAIRSLYFDTLDDGDYQDKEDGVEVRRKIRLRNYGPQTPFAVLEMKQKQGAMQKKRSLRLERTHALEVSRGRYGVLLEYGKEPFALECYALMQTRCYRPAAVVEYRRKAFIAKENKIRITLDHHIIGTESSHDLFSPSLLQSCMLDPYLAVLEVKYNGFLPSYIKDLLLSCNESESAVSKYCLSRSVSKHYVF